MPKQVKVTYNLSYNEFMAGMCNAPWDDDKCGKCGGNALKPVFCCNGFECCCSGRAIEFEDCDCGNEPPSVDQIIEWARN